MTKSSRLEAFQQLTYLLQQRFTNVECVVLGSTRSCVDELGQSPCLSIYSIYINTKHLTTHDELEMAGDSALPF
jgi:hypothetical protein